MTEPNKHRRAAPKRAARPERSTWPPSLPVLILLAVVLVTGAALGIRLLLADDEEAVAAPGAGGDPGAVNGSYGNQWTTVDGSSYEITIETLSDLVQGQTGSGCLAAPAAGTANLHFRILITNRSDTEADVPRVDFGTDLAAGGVDASKKTFAASNKNLVIERPAAGAQDCKDAARLSPAGREKIPAGGVVEFTGTFGPIRLPAQEVPTVIYRYYAEEGGKPKPVDLLAPFQRF